MSEENTSPVLLSDVLGSMVSSIAQARQIADVAAVNLAYAYQRHELLKGMAVPRLRFRSVDVSLPVLIQQVHEARKPELDSAHAIAKRVADEVKRRAVFVAQKLRFELATEALSQEQHAQTESFALFWEKVSTDEIAVQVHDRVENQLEARVIRTFTAGGKSPAAGTEASIRSEVAASIQSGIRMAFWDMLSAPATSAPDEAQGNRSAPSGLVRFSELQQHYLYVSVLESASNLASDTCFRTPSVPAALELVVCTDDVKNKGGGIDNIARIRFTLLEEGLEWVEDEQGRRLITE